MHVKFVHVEFQKKVAFYSDISLLKIQVKIPIYVWNTDRYKNTSLSRLKSVPIDRYICNNTIFFQKALHYVSRLFRKILWHRLSSALFRRTHQTSVYVWWLPCRNAKQSTTLFGKILYCYTLIALFSQHWAF